MAKKKTPLQLQLVSNLPRSRRHPHGLRRCKRVIRKEGELPRQCKRAARKGFPVCGKHGAGFLAREQSGERKPVRSNLRHGARSRPDTLAAVREEQPILQSLIDEYLKSDEYVQNWRHISAVSHALLDMYLVNSDLDNDPEACERLIPLCGQIMDIRLKLVRAFKEGGVVTPRTLHKLMLSIAHLIQTYVPKDLQSEAFLFLREGLFPDPPRSDGRPEPTFPPFERDSPIPPLPFADEKRRPRRRTRRGR
mgnify:CR=1 FL=1